MRSEALLDSAVFQLTPTRTRCDLVIISNGEKEKLASGLLYPFVAHLKTAQDQISKGGYSIILEPDPEKDAAWFTKGTVERFVRFVSTPEVLERVSNIESEILQIDNAIAIQSNDNFGLNTVAEDQPKAAEATDGIKTSIDVDPDKAIVLYKPGSQSNQPDSNGSTTQENSKVQLFRVLETRKMALQKEQGMAFARAAAADFDMDEMLDLISFAESFGASRLKEACLRFMDLWKKKHENGQWLEVEAAEAMSMRSEFSALNASGIVFLPDSMIQNGYGAAQSSGDMVTENHGNTDKQIPSDANVSLGHQVHFQGQLQHPTYPQWPMHLPPGHSVVQPYNVQGMPYYQNHPGRTPYLHPAYPPMEDPRFNTSRRKGSKRQSIDSKDIENETCGRSPRSQDDTDESTSDLEKDISHDHKSHKRVGQAGKKKSSVVVIENLNYITSKEGVGDFESKSQSDSESKPLEQNEAGDSDMRVNKLKHSVRTHKKAVEYSEAYSNGKAADGGVADSGNWQAFQNLLLRAEENTRRVDAVLAGEKEHSSKRKQSKGEADPLVLHNRDCGDFPDQRMVGSDSVYRKASQMKQAVSDDPVLVSRNEGVLTGNRFMELDSRGRAYKQRSNDQFMIYGPGKQLSSKASSDPFIDRGDEHDGYAVKSSSKNIGDESFMLPYRSHVQGMKSGSITGINMDSEFPSALQRAQEPYGKVKNKLIYEPHDLSMVPERGTEGVSVVYDPVMEYGRDIPHGNSVKLKVSKPEGITTSAKEAYKKAEKQKNLSTTKDCVAKRRKDALMKKGSSSRLSPLTEAQKRAEKLRTYKSDLQKVKKEREEEEHKRLEALKSERQKRIAARSSSTATHLSVTPQQKKSRLVTKPLPSTYKGSKFSDSEPVSFSPFRKLPIRTSSTGSIDPQKAAKPNRINGRNHGLARLTSSVPAPKRGNNGLLPEAKADSLRMKRLSDPKGSYTQLTFLAKTAAAKPVPKRSIPDVSQKKITAIMQLDQSKSAILPEIRIRTPKASLERVKKESSSKGALNKGTGSKASGASGSINFKLSKNTPSNCDENLVIEKTVVALESNRVAAPIVRQSGKILDGKEGSHGDGLVKGYVTIRAPPSPIVMAKDGDTDQSKLDKRLNPREVVAPRSRNESHKFSNSVVTEKPNQALDPLTANLRGDGSQTASRSATVATRITNFERLSLGDQTHEAHEKHQIKETKGLRKLLNFARKSHSSVAGEGNVESDASPADDETTGAGSSNDVNILKNLLSQDDAGGTPPKVSRPFSLLSPFRSKNSERKPATR